MSDDDGDEESILCHSIPVRLHVWRRVVIRTQALTCAEKVVAFDLADNAPDADGAGLSLPRALIQEHTQLGENVVRNALKILRALLLLEPDGKSAPRYDSRTPVFIATVPSDLGHLGLKGELRDPVSIGHRLCMCEDLPARRGHPKVSNTQNKGAAAAPYLPVDNQKKGAEKHPLVSKKKGADSAPYVDNKGAESAPYFDQCPNEAFLFKGFNPLGENPGEPITEVFRPQASGEGSASSVRSAACDRFEPSGVGPLCANCPRPRLEHSAAAREPVAVTVLPTLVGEHHESVPSDVREPDVGEPPVSPVADPTRAVAGVGPSAVAVRVVSLVDAIHLVPSNRAARRASVRAARKASVAALPVPRARPPPVDAVIAGRIVSIPVREGLL